MVILIKMFASLPRSVSPKNLLSAFAAVVSLACVPANAQQSEDATVNQAKRTAHKVSGWEHGLVKKTPNLSKYYWTPLTEYSQNKGSRRTGKGVQSQSKPSTQLTRHYVKPRFAPLPKNDRAEFSASEIQARSNVSARVRFDKAKNQLASRRFVDTANDCSGVLTYGDKDKSEGYSYKRQNLSVTGRLYGQKRKTVEQ